MRRTGECFSLDIPDDWTQSIVDGQLIAESPSGHELIIAGTTLEPAALPTALSAAFTAAIALIESLLTNATHITRAQTDTRYQVEATIADAFLAGAVLTSPKGTLLLTLEGDPQPDEPPLAQTFAAILASVIAL